MRKQEAKTTEIKKVKPKEQKERKSKQMRLYATIENEDMTE